MSKYYITASLQAGFCEISFPKSSKRKYVSCNLFSQHTLFAIAQYDLENNLLNTFLSGAEAIQLGLSTASINSVGNRIRECANNKRQTAYGFVWKFL